MYLEIRSLLSISTSWWPPSSSWLVGPLSSSRAFQNEKTLCNKSLPISILGDTRVLSHNNIWILSKVRRLLEENWGWCKHEILHFCLQYHFNLIGSCFNLQQIVLLRFDHWIAYHFHELQFAIIFFKRN